MPDRRCPDARVDVGGHVAALLNPDPDGSHVVRIDADEPQVLGAVAGAGLAAHRPALDACGFGEAALAGAEVVDHALNHVQAQVGDLRRPDPVRALHVVGHVVEHLAARGGDAGDVARRVVQAPVGKRRVGRRHLDRGGLDRAQRRRQPGAVVGRQIEFAQLAEEGRQPHLVGDAHGGQIQRAVERFTQGHRAACHLALEVLGGVDAVLATGAGKADRFVVTLAELGELAGREGGGVEQRLDGRADLALALRGVVPLGRGHAGAQLLAHHAQHVTVERVADDGGQGGARRNAGVQAGLLDAELNARVEGGVDPQPAGAVDLFAAQSAHQFLLDLLHEIRKAHGVDGFLVHRRLIDKLGAQQLARAVVGHLPAARHQLFLPGGVGLLLGDPAVLHHAGQQRAHVAALGRVVVVAPARTRHQGGEVHALGQIEFARGLAEVRLRGRVDAVEFHRTAVTPVNDVEVVLQDLLFGKGALDLHAEHPLLDLAVRGAGQVVFLEQQGIAHQLVGQRAAALHVFFLGEAAKLPGNAVGIEAVVLKEAPVLVGDQGRRHERTDLVELDQGAAHLLVADARDQRAQRGVVAGVDAGDGPQIEGVELAKVRQVARPAGAVGGRDPHPHEQGGDDQPADEFQKLQQQLHEHVFLLPAPVKWPARAAQGGLFKAGGR